MCDIWDVPTVGARSAVAPPRPTRRRARPSRSTVATPRRTPPGAVTLFARDFEDVPAAGDRACPRRDRLPPHVGRRIMPSCPSDRGLARHLKEALRLSPRDPANHWNPTPLPRPRRLRRRPLSRRRRRSARRSICATTFRPATRCWPRAMPWPATRRDRVCPGGSAGRGSRHHIDRTRAEAFRGRTCRDGPYLGALRRAGTAEQRRRRKGLELSPPGGPTLLQESIGERAQHPVDRRPSSPAAAPASARPRHGAGRARREGGGAGPQPERAERVAAEIGARPCCDVDQRRGGRRGGGRGCGGLGAPLRILVNCAGIAHRQKTRRPRRSARARRVQRKVVAVNLVGTFNMIRLAAAAMARREPAARTASAASSSTPPRSPRSTGRSARRPTRRPRAASPA